MLNFERDNLIQELEGLAPSLRVAFAAACAERLLPAYLAYSGRYETGSPDTLRAALDATWRVALGGALDCDANAEFERCVALIPGDDEYDHESTAYAEYAVSSVAYAVGTAGSPDPQMAIRAANCVYEALDNYVSNALDTDFNRPGAEASVLGHSLIQVEFERQRRDLHEMAAVGSDSASVVLRVQKRAVEGARALFGDGN